MIIIYFLYSLDSFLLKKQLAKLIKNLNPLNNAEIIEFSLIENSIIDLDNEINTYSLFGEQKIIIINEAWFVNEQKIALHKDFQTDKLMQLLKKRNPDVIIIFTLNSDKFSKKLKICKWIEQNCQIEQIQVLTPEMIRQYLKQSFIRQKQEIDDQAINYMLDHLPNYMQIISNEVNKLLALKSHINLTDVQQNLTKYFESNVFEISAHFIANELDQFLMKFNDYLALNNNDMLSLIALLATNVSLTRNALILKQQGYDQTQIANQLSVHPYRLKMALQINKSNIKNLNDKIIMLYNLNKNILSSKSDGKVMPEYEFVKVMKG